MNRQKLLNEHKCFNKYKEIGKIQKLTSGIFFLFGNSKVGVT